MELSNKLQTRLHMDAIKFTQVSDNLTSAGGFDYGECDPPLCPSVCYMSALTMVSVIPHSVRLSAICQL